MRKIIYKRNVKDSEATEAGWSTLLNDNGFVYIPDNQVLERKFLEVSLTVDNRELTAILEIRELDNVYIMYANDIPIAVAMKVTNEQN